MTTRVTVCNEGDSNPAQELVVEVTGGISASSVIRADGSADNSMSPVLRPGDKFEAWISSGTRIALRERDAKK